MKIYRESVSERSLNFKFYKNSEAQKKTLKKFQNKFGSLKKFRNHSRKNFEGRKKMLECEKNQKKSIKFLEPKKTKKILQNNARLPAPVPLVLPTSTPKNTVLRVLRCSECSGARKNLNNFWSNAGCSTSLQSFLAPQLLPKKTHQCLESFSISNNQSARLLYFCIIVQYIITLVECYFIMW